MSKYKIEGYKELQKKLLTYGAGAWRKHTRRGFVRAGRLVKTAMKSTAPADTELLRKSFSTKQSVRIRKRKVPFLGGYCVIGPRSDYKKEVTRTVQLGPDAQEFTVVKTYRPAKYAHLTEGGTQERIVKNFMGRRGMWKAVGRTTGKRWMYRAYRSTQTRASAIMEQALLAGINEEARKR